MLLPRRRRSVLLVVLGTLLLCTGSASADGRWQAVAAGDTATCALSNSGTVSCWGENTSGILGPGRAYASVSSQPRRVAGLPRARALALTGSTACIVDRRARVWCWGDRKGKDGVERSRVARRVAGITGATGVAVASEAACAKRSSGLWCWAWGADSAPGLHRLTRKPAGRIRMDSDIACLVPTPSGQPRCFTLPYDGEQPHVLRVRLGAVADLWFAPENDEESGLNFCALSVGGTVRCSDSYLDAALDGTQRALGDVAARLPGTRLFASVTSDSVCALGPAGLRCAEDGSTRPSAVVKVAGSRGIQAVGGDDPGSSFGWGGLGAESHVCVLSRAGRIACLGDNADGRLGSGAGPRPGLVPGVEDAVEVVAGATHVCSRSAAGKVQCWGGAYGAGRGALTDDEDFRPRDVPLPGPATALYAAARLTCAIVDRYPWCWGYASSKAGSSASDVPVKLERLGEVDALAVWTNAVCGRAAGAPLQCVRASTGASTLVWRAPSKPFGDTPVTTFTEVGYDVCALVGGQAECRVVPGDASTPTPAVQYSIPAPGVTSLSGGTWDTACLAGEGDIACWGFEGYSGGSHGPESYATHRLRRPFGPSAGWQVTTGSFAACAIPAVAGVAGDVVCRPINTTAGNGASGWLFSGSVKATSVAVGNDFACAVTTGRRVSCWGDGSRGALGRGSDGGATSRLVAVPAPRR